MLDAVVLLLYAAINLISFLLMGIDKWKAKRGAYRISEKTLLIWCLCFGGLGGWIGMQSFRHKTQHKKFTLTVPVMMGVQIVLLLAYFGFGR